jgi:hypothetical protein
MFSSVSNAARNSAAQELWRDYFNRNGILYQKAEIVANIINFLL